MLVFASRLCRAVPAVLQAATAQGADPVILAESLPGRWAEFMRNAPMDSVRPLGTRAADRLKRASFAQQGGQLDIPDLGTAPSP